MKQYFYRPLYKSVYCMCVHFKENVGRKNEACQSINQSVKSLFDHENLNGLPRSRVKYFRVS